MRHKRSNKNLKAKDKELDKSYASEKLPAERKSWQLKVLRINGPCQACSLMHNIANVHVCNNKRLMAHSVKRLKWIGKSKSKEISLGQEKVQLQLAVLRERKKERVTLILNNVYYFLNNLSNLISFALFNNNKICLNNRNKIFYDNNTKEILASIQ